MAMVVNSTFMDLDFFRYSTTATTTTTTTTSIDDDCCNWSDWFTDVNWGELSGNEKNINDIDFSELLESNMCENADIHCSSWPVPDGQSSAVSPETMMMDAEDDDCDQKDFKGLRLVHLLMAAVEALTGASKSRELARVILVRLKELVSPNDGTNMERLAAYFTEALQCLLEGSAGAPGTHGKHMLNNHGPHYNDDHNYQTDVLAAFQLLQDMSPYVKFGYFTANQSILEAVTHERRVHIVDYDIMEGIQWASLMQALLSRKDGPSTPHLRITALSRSGNGRRSFGTIQETGRRLTAFAASIGQPFSFHQYRLDADETFRPSTLKLVRGEAVVINCMLHLPHFIYRAPNSIASFLSGAKTLNPRLVTLVEEEVGPTVEGEFVGKFMDSLLHYSAIFDSLEAGFPMQGRARALVERAFLGPKIAGSVAHMYRARVEDDWGSWGERLAAMGFQHSSISFANHCQAKLLLGLFNDGYRVEELANNKLVLGWKSRRLLSASAWTSPDNDL